MQPTFLPWLGYFNLINSVDIFVFLDDVQLEKQSWQTRNQFIISNEKFWVSLPISNSKLKTIIAETRFKNTEIWIKKNKKKIFQNYSKCKFFHEINGINELIFDFNNCYLSDYNTRLIKYICKKLEINTKFFFSSSMKIEKNRLEKIDEICRILNANQYFAAIGSKDYMLHDNYTSKMSVNVKFFDYPIRKDKLFRNHIQNSIYDVIANFGYENVKNRIKKL